MKNRKIYLIIILAVIIAIISSIYFLFFTSIGSSSLVKYVISRYLDSSTVDFKDAEGNISKAVTINDISITDLEGFPEGSILEIKSLELSIRSFDIEGIYLDIKNARLTVPGEDPLFFYGTCKDNSLDFNLYSSSLDIKTIIELLDLKTLSSVSGDLSELDLYISGSLLEPRIGGKFKIDQGKYDLFSIKNAPVSFNIKLRDIPTDLSMSGEITIISGDISGPKTAKVALENSKIFFNKDPKNPSLSLKGASTVGNTSIKITLNGTMKKPDIILSSDPPLPKEKLLLMLATNRSWDGVEAALQQGQVSTEAVREFMNYFVFSGSGSRLTESLGLKGVSFKFDESTKGIGLKKDLTGKAEVNYAIEESYKKDGDPSSTQKIGTDYKLTDTLSVGAEKEIKQAPGVTKE
ncbi:MAG: translocation/assembly module TamB domain-containing protein [Candidatus Omnitrophota bacterium]